MIKSNKSNKVQLGTNIIGENEPIYLVGEIGINHNGDLELAKKLIHIAAECNFNAVKFQKRTPLSCVPADQHNIMRQTPWGEMRYIDYKERMEFNKEQFSDIDLLCKNLNLDWFVSCWDTESVDFMENFSPNCYKIASASITNHNLLKRHKETNRTIILSTGMSTMEEICEAVELIGTENLILLHSTSTYPCPFEEVNLKMIDTLKKTFNVPVGYSGHELGIEVSLAAAALGACVIERHITLDSTMWGSDQKASLEPESMKKLERSIRIIEESMGDGIKKVYEAELEARKRLRKTS